MGARTLDRRTVLKGRVLDVGIETVELPNGVRTELEILRHPGAAAILPLTDDGVLLIRQHRHAAGGWLWEIPAGTLEPGEAPVDCALRELQEEAGVRAAELVPLGPVLPVPGYSTERIELFLARGLEPAPGRLDADEVVMEVRSVPLEELRRWVREAELIDAKSVVAIARADARGLLSPAAPVGPPREVSR